MPAMFTLPRARPLTAAGRVMPGAKLHFYLLGTTTYANVYTDAACTIASSNPLIADANGQFAPVFLNASRKVVLADASDVEQWTLAEHLAGSIASTDVIYARTAAEIAAGVTPTNYAIEPPYPARYGAVGNGVADDTAALAAALAVSRHVVVPPGTYNVSSSGLSMSVAGTCLELQSGATISLQSATSTGFSVTAQYCAIKGPGVIQSPATFDGTNGARTYAVMWVTGEDFTLDGVRLLNIPRCGVRLENVARANIRDNIAEGNYPYASYNDATTTAQIFLDIDAPTTSGVPLAAINVTGNTISECIQGVFVGNLGAAGTEAGLTVTGNNFYRCWDHAVYGTLGEGGVVSGNAFYDCRRAIVVDGIGVAVTGNSLYSTETSNSYGQQIINVRESNGANVSGNTLYGVDACIRVDAITGGDDTLENCTVADNTIIRTGYAQIGSAIRLGFDATVCRNNRIAGNNISGTNYQPTVGVIQLEMFSGSTGSNNVIENNVIRVSMTDSGGEGGRVIQAQNHDGVVIRNNVMEVVSNAASAAVVRFVYLISGLNADINDNTFRYATGGTNVTARGIQTSGTVTGGRAVRNRFYFTSGSLAASDPIGTASGIELRENQLAGATAISGSFTCAGAVTTTVNNANVHAASRITLTPTNAAAATLQGSAKCLYVSARTAGTSFAVSTANAVAAGGTETFDYVIE